MRWQHALLLSMAGVLACGERGGSAYDVALAAGTAAALREFVGEHPDAAEASLVRARLAALGPELEGFEAVLPSEVAYVCHLEPNALWAPIPEDVIAYIAKNGAVIAWSRLSDVFVYGPPFAMRPALDARGPVGLAKNAAGQAVRTGKRCINGVQYDGDTVNVADGLKFAPGGTLSGPRR